MPLRDHNLPQKGLWVAIFFFLALPIKPQIFLEAREDAFKKLWSFPWGKHIINPFLHEEKKQRNSFKKQLFGSCRFLIFHCHSLCRNLTTPFQEATKYLQLFLCFLATPVRESQRKSFLGTVKNTHKTQQHDHLSAIGCILKWIKSYFR